MSFVMLNTAFLSTLPLSSYILSSTISSNRSIISSSMSSGFSSNFLNSNISFRAVSELNNIISSEFSISVRVNFIKIPHSTS